MATHDWALAAEPREWQLQALATWESNHQGIAAVVTGAGKTILAEMCMLRYRREFPAARFVIVVPTLSLLDQWYVSLREDLHVRDEDIATYSGEGRAREPRLINLVVLNTAREVAPGLAHGEAVMLIVDECHRAASPVNARALSGNYTATLGLSATPERQYDEGFEEFLVPALGPIITRYDYNSALEDGVISRFKLVNVGIELNAVERGAYDKITRKIAPLMKRARDGEEVDDRLKRLLMQRASVAANAKMRIPAALRIVSAHRGARTLVFHERIAAAEEIKAALTSRGVNATIYHSRIGSVTRRDNLRMFRRGLFDVMVSCRALDEGTNVPETTIAVIASSTASVRQRVQRLGRVLRPAPGKDLAVVYTVYATDVEEERLVKEASDLVGAESVTWQRMRLEANGKVNRS